MKAIELLNTLLVEYAKVNRLENYNSYCGYAIYDEDLAYIHTVGRFDVEDITIPLESLFFKTGYLVIERDEDGSLINANIYYNTERLLKAYNIIPEMNNPMYTVKRDDRTLTIVYL
jgi:hypothetical protein